MGSSSTTRISGRFTCVDRQLDRERRAAAGRRVDADVTAVGLDEAAADGEPEAGAGAAVVARPQPVVGLEDAPALGFGHAVAVVDDRDPQRRAVARRVQAEGVIGVGAAGILEEVDEHLADHRLVDAHGRQLGGAVDVDDVPVERRGGIVDGRVEQLVDGHQRAPWRSTPASMRERSSMLATSRTSRSASCSMSAQQRLALVLGHVLAQSGGRGRDRGQRRAKVVRHGLQKRRAQPVGLLQSVQQHALVLEACAPQREPEDAAERLEHRRPSPARCDDDPCRRPGSRR